MKQKKYINKIFACAMMLLMLFTSVAWAQEKVTADEVRATANATTPYIVATVNLDETGPFVIDLPAGAIAGMVDDFWQRPVTDLELPGPDKGKGAKYPILPPGNKDDSPKGYAVVKSPTDNI